MTELSFADEAPAVEQQLRVDAGVEQLLLDALTQYGAVKDAQVTGSVVGEHTTCFELQLPAGRPLTPFNADLGRHLAYALEAQLVKITAPIPGRRAVAIEISNRRGAEHAPPLRPQEALDAESAPQLYCASLPEFLEQVLFPMYRRKVGGGRDDVRWCEQWWKHAEAIARLDALWRAWEHLRLDPATGISVWFRDHADPHMAVLLSEHGPFADCQLAHAHRDTEAIHKDLPQLPRTAPPPGLLAE